MPGMDEDERTRTAFGVGHFTFQAVLLGKRELSGLSLGRHWAVGLLHSRGNVVLHIRNFEIGDSIDLSSGYSSSSSSRSSPTHQIQLRITSWAMPQFLAYRGIVFQDAIYADLDALRETAWGLYSDPVFRNQNCQEYAIRLLERLGVQMHGWMQQCNCYNSSGNVISTPLREKKSLYNPVKLLSFGILHRLSSAHWDSCTVHFNRVLRELSTTWTASYSQSTDSSCCICLDKPREYACVPCGHLCICERDRETVLNVDIPQCPICRSGVSSLLRVYQS